MFFFYSSSCQLNPKLSHFLSETRCFPDPPAQHYHRLASVALETLIRGIRGLYWTAESSNICVRVEFVNLGLNRSPCMYHWHVLFMILLVWSQSSIRLHSVLSNYKDPQQHSSHINTHLTQVKKKCKKQEPANTWKLFPKLVLIPSRAQKRITKWRLQSTKKTANSL